MKINCHLSVIWKWRILCALIILLTWYDLKEKIRKVID